MSNATASYHMRLTALWALSESGLGGVMHAFKIPFTGFFLGGFAIVVITLLAFNGQNDWKNILRATLLVMLVKASASPHSPPMAYIAVGFQGLSGAVLFGLISNKKLAAMCFGFIALLESAVQKFLITTLIFGKSVWEALDLFFINIAKDLHLASDFSFSFWLIACYTSVYAVWGVITGRWAALLPDKMNKEVPQILHAYLQYQSSAEISAIEQQKKRNLSVKFIATLFVLLFVFSTFLLLGSSHQALYAVARTIAALLILFFIINPLFKWMLQRWLSKEKQKNAAGFDELILLIPELKNLITPAFYMSRQQFRGLKLYRQFVFTLIVLALYQTNK